MIPTIITVFDAIEKLLSGFNDFNNMMGGIPAYALAFGGLAAGIATVVTVFSALNSITKVGIVLQTIMATLSGNWAAIAAAAGISAVVGISLSNLGQDHANDKLDDIADNTKRTAESVMDMNINSLSGGGRVGNLIRGNMQVEYAVHNALRLR